MKRITLAILAVALLTGLGVSPASAAVISPQPISSVHCVPRVHGRMTPHHCRLLPRHRRITPKEISAPARWHLITPKAIRHF